jgi:thymidine kinase
MAKLYFRYGTVGSAKTLNLLSVFHTYRLQGKNCLLLKPKIDSRFGVETVKSRAGLERKADLVVTEDSEILADDLLNLNKNSNNPHCIVVDEVQFFEEDHIDDLRQISVTFDIPVICYGLRTDFRGELFPASKRLFELADSIEEVKNVCHYCNKKSTMNIKHVDGQATKDGPSVELGAEEKYFPVCYSCYREMLNE